MSLLLFKSERCVTVEGGEEKTFMLLTKAESYIGKLIKNNEEMIPKLCHWVHEDGTSEVKEDCHLLLKKKRKEKLVTLHRKQFILCSVNYVIIHSVTVLSFLTSLFKYHVQYICKHNIIAYT